MKRTAHVLWNGDGKDGNGTLSTQSGAINKLSYNFKMRFENENGELGTNPEELIAAAHAACFNMKLSFVLNEKGYHPDVLTTDSELTFIDGDIESINLNLNAKIPNITDEKFMDFAYIAKNECPISNVLNCKITLNAVLE